MRFQAPRPPSSWTGVLNATVEPPACLQPRDDVPYPITYSEDCLFVNVFTPYLRHPSGKPMPVLVWVHGGFFNQGSGSSYHYGPDFLLKKDVILVTFNYRLGVLGFLSLNVSEAQGNAALKDSVAALKWVKREISNFGGDPNLVTLFGESSGGGVVSLLYVSPMARGLFSRAISHSGAFDFSVSTVGLCMELARAVGCHSSDTADMLACLYKVDGEELCEKQLLFGGVNRIKNPFLPTLEADLGEEVFLPECPRTLAAQAPEVPYLMGVDNGEGLMFVNDPAENPDQFTMIDKEINKNLPRDIVNSASDPVLEEVVAQIEEFYIGNNSSLADKVHGFVDFMSDNKYIYGVTNLAKLISVRAPVYLYYFTFEGEFQVKDHKYLKLNVPISGVCHGEELGYFFYRNYTLPEQNTLFAYPRDMDMVDKVTTMWTDFASYGNPTPFEPKESNCTWLPAKGEFTQYLLVADVIRMVKSPLLKRRMDFWDQLYDFIFSNAKKANPFHEIQTTGVFLVLCFVLISIVFVLNYLRHKDYDRIGNK